MGALLALLNPLNKVLEAVLPNKEQQDAAKAALAQSMASGEFQQTLAETQGATQIITAEANSQSWVARNVRPLLLLIWGLVITAHEIAPVFIRIWEPGYVLAPLDPWVYKLTAIGYTGYVGFRTWEKLQGKDT
jgi:Holin of 3TMs, for gene-transfer release